MTPHPHLLSLHAELDLISTIRITARYAAPSGETYSASVLVTVELLCFDNFNPRNIEEELNVAYERQLYGNNNYYPNLQQSSTTPALYRNHP